MFISQRRGFFSGEQFAAHRRSRLGAVSRSKENSRQLEKWAPELEKIAAGNRLHDDHKRASVVLPGNITGLTPFPLACPAKSGCVCADDRTCYLVTKQYILIVSASEDDRGAMCARTIGLAFPKSGQRRTNFYDPIRQADDRGEIDHTRILQKFNWFGVRDFNCSPLRLVSNHRKH